MDRRSRTGARAQHHLREIFHAANRAFGTHDQRVFTRIQTPRTVVAVVAPDGSHHVREAQAAGGKAGTIRHHGKALGLAAQHVDVGHPG
ncbi:hypothetical protein SDC9_101771 [bioreactor metagenome]|uniref:Uncharacterized protein n=1 Tax=bioreactor metagenome TaxID=1076179 RepID=A0A645AQE7_9ZZZZ